MCDKRFEFPGAMVGATPGRMECYQSGVQINDYLHVSACLYSLHIQICSSVLLIDLLEYFGAQGSPMRSSGFVRT